MGVFWWTFLVFSLGPIFTVCVPVQIQNQTKVDPSAPLEFPQVSQNYTFVDNSSIRENLTNHQQALIDTEVEDLMEIPKDVETPTTPITKKPQFIEETLGKKSETEWIENGDDTEDSKLEREEISTEASLSTVAGVEKMKSSTLKISTLAVVEKMTSPTPKISTILPVTLPQLLKAVTEINAQTSEIFKIENITEKIDQNESNFYENGVPLLNGTVAAVLAVSFLVLCVFGYAALIIWRKALEAKYGSREMLVDDDDIFDPDDMKHFSI